jgi:hypothetical protein
MGKATDNEQLKLRATWYNNVSVGLFVTGVAIPSLLLPQKFSEIAVLFGHWRAGTTQEWDVSELLSIFVPFVVAMFFSFYFRFRSHHEVTKLDEYSPSLSDQTSGNL